MGMHYQKDWNSAAIDCAAQLLAGALGELPDLLGPTRLWGALENARALTIGKQPDSVDEALGAPKDGDSRPRPRLDQRRALGDRRRRSPHFDGRRRERLPDPRALQHLKESKRSSYYRDASPTRYPNSRQQCDLVISHEWAIEFKLLRPFGDNGAEAEHWSENVLHPYPGNVSSIGDSIKLIQSGFTERNAVVIFGYEHSPPLIDITTAIESFEAIAKQVVGIEL
jgi:hypothetical protein